MFNHASSVPRPAISREIIALTSLRGIAAMAVVMQHFSTTAQLHAMNNIPSLVPHGYLAVDLFFMLSGFIMAYTYLASFETYGRGAFPSFLLKRIARIAPLNVVVIALFLLAGLASTSLLGHNIIYPPKAGLGDIIANLLMLQGLGIGLNINGPSWSISAEFVAYLLFPMLILGVFSSKRWLRTALLVVSILSILWLSSHYPRFGLATESVHENLIRCFSEFTIGMTAFYFYRHAAAATIATLASDLASAGLMLACAAFMLLRIDLLAVALFPWLILSLAWNTGRVAKLMANRALYLLGLVSFSLYLLHQLFRPIALLLIQHVHPEAMSTAYALAFAFVASLAVVPFAWLTYRFVELPGRTLVQSLHKSRRAVTNATAAQPAPQAAAGQDRPR